jgi:hypothetical protein
MATIKITNGFLDYDKDSANIILTGTLLSGTVKNGDLLVINNATNASLIKVEFDSEIDPEITHLRLFVPEENKIVWHKLYGNVYETKCAQSSHNCYRKALS